MAITNIWILPVFTSFYSICTLLVCYSVTVLHHHEPNRWPFLSELATRAPESCIYAMMNNHLVVLLAIWMCIKHWEIQSYLRGLQREDSIWGSVSRINMFIGLAAAGALQISVNFPSRIFPTVQWASMIVSTFGWMNYVLLHSILSYCIVDPSVPRKSLLLIRLFISTTVSSFALTTFKALLVTGMLKKEEGSEIAAICEWGVYFALSFFLLTDSYEFRCLTITPLKLIIPGSVLYDQVTHRDRAESDFDPQREYMYDPLIH